MGRIPSLMERIPFVATMPGIYQTLQAPGSRTHTSFVRKPRSISEGLGVFQPGLPRGLDAPGWLSPARKPTNPAGALP